MGACLLSLSACGVGRQSESTLSSTEARPITEVVIGNGSGDVTIRGGDGAATRIDRVVSYRGQAPGSTYRIDGTVLHIDTRCGDDCSVSYELEVPRGVAVRGSLASSEVTLADLASVDLTVSSGDVQVSNTAGAVAVAGNSGDIIADGVAGTVRLTSTSGDIEGRDLRGGAEMETTSGAVNLTFTRAAPVTARTTSGDIAVRVPAGRYAVQAATQSGTKQVSVPDEPGATTRIGVESTAGDVTVTTAG